MEDCYQQTVAYPLPVSDPCPLAITGRMRYPRKLYLLRKKSVDGPLIGLDQMTRTSAGKVSTKSENQRA